MTAVYPPSYHSIVVYRSKLAVGLLSGCYSKAPEGEQHDSEQEGIPPAMLKRIVGKGHPEFSTNKQQVCHD
jgi:ubiquitin carboxyl-terminal hydrolase 5/13